VPTTGGSPTATAPEGCGGIIPNKIEPHMVSIRFLRPFQGEFIFDFNPVVGTLANLPNYNGANKVRWALAFEKTVTQNWKAFLADSVLEDSIPGALQAYVGGLHYPLKVGNEEPVKRTQ
jgi:hypothetical protein